MKTFSAFQKHFYREYDWRKPDKDGKIAAANFRTDFDAGPIPVGVEFTRSKEFHGKREYEATFEVDNTFYSPTFFDHHNPKEVERIARAAPEILKKVQATIEKFIQEKKPNAIRLAPNEAKKQPLYHAFARALARKYGGTVEIKGNGFSEFPGSNTYIVKLPGKQLREATKLVRKYYNLSSAKKRVRPVTQTFEDEGKVGLPYKVTFQRYYDDPKREYSIDFSVADRYMAPKEGDSWDSPEEVRRHKENAHNIPEILRRIRGHIDDFAAKKRPNTLKFFPNDPSKTPLYQAFAHALAKKHGGTVKVDRTLGPDTPTFVIKLPGKKPLKESREGTPLKGDPDEYVKILRAQHHSTHHIQNKDYVTMSHKFAEEHAEHQHAVTGEPHHVVKAIVKRKHVQNAPNPGEYFYNGPAIKGKRTYMSKNK